MERQRPRTGNTILKENQVGGLTQPPFKTYDTAIVTRTVWYWRKHTQTGQWNRTDSPEIDPHKYSQLNFDKGAEAIEWRKDKSLFNKWC